MTPDIASISQTSRINGMATHTYTKKSTIDPYTIKAYIVEHKKRNNIVTGEETYIFVLQHVLVIVRGDFPLRE